MNTWPDQVVTANWKPDLRTRIINQAGYGPATARAVALDPEDFEDGDPSLRKLLHGRRKPARIPTIVDERLARFAGYLVGDGHISRVKRHLGLTTGDEPQARAFVELAYELFDQLCTMKLDGNRWRVLVHSETVSDFLIEGLGFTHGPSARREADPGGDPAVAEGGRCARSCAPISTVTGYAGKAGVILSTSSDSDERAECNCCC